MEGVLSLQTSNELDTASLDGLDGMCERKKKKADVAWPADVGEGEGCYGLSWGPVG